MKVFTAHVRAGRPPVLVREGFSWLAFIFGPLWLLRHGAWLALLITAAVLVLIATLAPPPVRPVLSFAVSLALGVFGLDLRRWSLERARYALTDVVIGRTELDAFHRLLTARPALLPDRLP